MRIIREQVAARAQRMLWGVVAKLLEVEETLAFLVYQLPDDTPPEMLEYRIPYDVAMEVDGSIRCSMDDDLKPMIARLQRAAVVTTEELVRAWEEAQKNRVN
jgi:hypothetical protein